MGKMQRTNLAWDKYIDYLIDAINGSKFMKRAEHKPMSTPKTATESHISTRSIHLRESADVAKRLAKGLELNEDYIYAAMLMHDAGHPFSAHEGEEIFNYMGELHDTQYFHHNAKGIEIILSEDICGKAISKIPNIDNNPELRQQLEDEFDYFLDVIISHDGEATKSEMLKARTYYPTIKDALRAKLRSANTQNSYKFIAQTPEGRLAKFADVIAYLASDMQDGFRLGILKGFSDDYLELFGEMFSTDYPGSREEKIECGRRIIEQMKKQNLREKRETRDFMLRQAPEVQKALTAILSRVMQQGLVVNEENVAAIQEIVEQEQANFRKKKIQDFFETKGAGIPEEQRDGLEEAIAKKSEEGISLDEMEEAYAEMLNTAQSQSNKIEEFVTKMLRTRSSVVYEVTSEMKEYFINDLIRNSKNSTTLQFSPAAWTLYLKAKDLNYKEFVKSTNWDYQTEEFPVAALELVEECAESLVKSGAIRNKFYDEDVKQYVTDEEARKYMRTKYRPEESYVSYRKEHGIGDLRAVAKPSSAKFTGTKEQHTLMKLFQDLYSYVENEDKVFAIRYENTFHAIRTRVAQKINNALTAGYQSRNSLYKEKSQAQIDAVRQEILQTYGTLDLAPEQKEEFIAKKIEEALGQIEQKMAIQLASDYVAGMTDRSFADIAIKTGHLSPDVLANGVRGTTESEKVNKIRQDLQEDTAVENTTKPEAPSDAGEGR